MNKEQMENWLCGKLQNTSYMFKSNCTNTPIYRNGRVFLDIYYRSNGQIRVAVSPYSVEMEQYEELLKKGLVFQKESANPTATHGKFAFFVSDNNIEKVLDYFLK